MRFSDLRETVGESKRDFHRITVTYDLKADPLDPDDAIAGDTDWLCADSEVTERPLTRISGKRPHVPDRAAAS